MWKWEWICWFVNLISRGPEDRVRRFRRLIERLSREADLDDGWWSVYRDYPKQAFPSTASLTRECPSQIANNEIAVVIQGPVIERDEMTVETLKLYRKTMPSSRLILSTWDDIAPAARDEIEAIGVTVVTSEKPELAGPHNLNLQITSTQRGLLEAKKLGCRYAMKTRADTRIHMADVDLFCRDMLHQFPIEGPCNQTDRFLVMDFATRLYVPYHPSDMMMFGGTDDLLSYWSPGLCGPELTFRLCDEFDEMLKQSIPEVVLCRSYLQRTGTEITDDLEQWWGLLANRFIVIDRDMIDLFWSKYNYNCDQRLGMLWDTSNMALCHFAQWMQIHSRGVMPSITIDQLRRQAVLATIEGDQSDAAAA